MANGNRRIAFDLSVGSPLDVKLRERAKLGQKSTEIVRAALISFFKIEGCS